MYASCMQDQHNDTNNDQSTIRVQQLADQLCLSSKSTAKLSRGQGAGAGAGAGAVHQKPQFTLDDHLAARSKATCSKIYQYRALNHFFYGRMEISEHGRENDLLPYRTSISSISGTFLSETYLASKVWTIRSGTKRRWSQSLIRCGISLFVGLCALFKEDFLRRYQRMCDSMMSPGLSDIDLRTSKCRRRVVEEDPRSSARPGNCAKTDRSASVGGTAS